MQRRIWAMTAVVTSKTNPRVKQLRAAFEGRRKLAEGQIAMEGPHLMAEALRSGMELKAIFVREDARELLSQLDLAEENAVVLSREVFASAVATESSQGIAALAYPPEARMPKRSDGLFLVLERLQDPGNLGTLVRSAEAFGAAAVLCLPGTADVWNQKALRASAGSAFRIPVIAVEIERLFALQNAGMRFIAAVAREGGTPEAIDLRGGCAVMIGNEGAGLSVELLALSDERATIPCPGAVESLNAAVAGSLLLYAASVQRRQT
ncbi:TrmH family RNA methyltransferase [Terriglobus saanensis]|uniref:tRNA/rRNA methyltransferase (SpoU) n=1 Tax=Terriglobus saanensis (strain ATCC BAA-1853 / DSM 23119 / SP1PR4) TaxID=401053 RepID=E8V0V9_TERSS|nr:RNA methyltransferase [Terriglobus saanensis]ADV82250.1 tRNA/rRNA methyltransferase (SpoU) [Terriglobus saanensis SP1PR4]